VRNNDGAFAGAHLTLGHQALDLADHVFGFLALVVGLE
jgi:hypothetical protein